MPKIHGARRPSAPNPAPEVPIWVASRDHMLVSQVATATAALGRQLRRLDRLPPIWPDPAHCECLLVDAELLPGLDSESSLGRGPRPPVVIISSRRPDHESWQRALRCGAVAVLDLSDRNLDLRAQLVRRVGATSSGRRVGLLASRGGAGCSALAVGMALAAAEHDRRVCLVDQDPLGGGLDLAMGLDQLPGPRWDDLYSDPQPDWAGLATALPGFSGVAVLSWGRHAICPIPVDPRLQDRALTQVTGDFDLTILDLGRCWGPENMQALNRCDALALLVPTELRALAGASRWAKLLAGQSARLGLVTHRTNSGNLPAANVADSIGLPVWAHLASERSVQLSLTRGELIPRHSALMRTSRKLLAQVAA